MKKMVAVVVAILIIWGISSYQSTQTKGDFYFSGQGSAAEAKLYIQSAIKWVESSGKVESNSTFERREIGNHTYYIAKARISNYCLNVNGRPIDKVVRAVVVAHSEVTNRQWITFLPIDRLDTFLLSGDRSAVLNADDLALEMSPYEEPTRKPKTPWSIELSIR